MEALPARIAAFCLQKHYIESDQIAWLRYGLMRRLMGMVTFLLLLLPVGAFFDGWGSTSLFLLIFRFIRMRTGGYHAKTPAGCLLGSTFTMIVSLEFARKMNIASSLLSLAVASCLILRLAPANNAALDGNQISHSKPDSEVFMLAAEKPHRKPSDCLVVIDAEAGVKAALNGGFLVAEIGSGKYCPNVNYPLVSLGELLTIEAHQA